MVRVKMPGRCSIALPRERALVSDGAAATQRAPSTPCPAACGYESDGTSPKPRLRCRNAGGAPRERCRLRSWERAPRTWYDVAMPGSTAHQLHTIEDYVRLEGFSNVKHEFLDGQVYAMGGGTPAHGTYAANLIRVLGNHVKNLPCRVQTSDVRVRVAATGLDTYPDISVVCGHLEVDKEDPFAIINPVLLVEVLSPSTEAYDRGKKLEHYKLIPSLTEVVFVAHDRQHVEVVRRDGDQWHQSGASSGEAIGLESVGLQLHVDDVYHDPLG